MKRTQAVRQEGRRQDPANGIASVDPHSRRNNARTNRYRSRAGEKLHVRRVNDSMAGSNSSTGRHSGPPAARMPHWKLASALVLTRLNCQHLRYAVPETEEPTAGCAYRKLLGKRSETMRRVAHNGSSGSASDKRPPNGQNAQGENRL